MKRSHRSGQDKTPPHFTQLTINRIPEASTPTTTLSIVKKPQSLALMISITRAIISGIVKVRRVFGDDESMFIHSFINPNDGDATCRTYMESVPIDLTKPHPVTIQSFPAVVPSRNRKANKMLTCIDGIAEAIQNQYLSSFQLGLYEYTLSPESLIEAYIVEITYDQAVPTLSVRNDKGTFSVDTVKTNWVQLVDKLHQTVEDIEDKDPMSTKPKVLFMLTYYDNAPEGYTPTGFGPCNRPEMLLKGYKSESIGVLDTGVDSLEVRVKRRKLC